MALVCRRFAARYLDPVSSANKVSRKKKKANKEDAYSVPSGPCMDEAGCVFVQMPTKAMRTPFEKIAMRSVNSTRVSFLILVF